MSVLSAEMPPPSRATPQTIYPVRSGGTVLDFRRKDVGGGEGYEGRFGEDKKEMKEAEEEIEEDDAAEGPRLRMVPLEDMEEGHLPRIVVEHGSESNKEGLIGESNAQSSARKPQTSCAEGARNFCILALFSFKPSSLTFLGESTDSCFNLQFYKAYSSF